MGQIYKTQIFKKNNHFYLLPLYMIKHCWVPQKPEIEHRRSIISRVSVLERLLWWPPHADIWICCCHRFCSWYFSCSGHHLNPCMERSETQYFRKVIFRTAHSHNFSNRRDFWRIAAKQTAFCTHYLKNLSFQRVINWLYDRFSPQMAKYPALCHCHCRLAMKFCSFQWLWFVSGTGLSKRQYHRLFWLCWFPWDRIRLEFPTEGA